MSLAKYTTGDTRNPTEWVKRADYDALAAELADMTADRDHWQRECNKATARIGEFEAAMNDLAHNARKLGHHAEAAWIYAKMNGSEQETNVKPCAICGAPDDATHGLNCETTSDRPGK